MATVEELRQQASTFLQERFGRPAGLETEPGFSAFRPSQVEEAAQLAREFSRLAAEQGGLDGVAAVLEAARQEANRRVPGLVKYALLIFLTHDPNGALVGAPTLEERHPQAVAAMVDTEASITAGDSDSLAFFREDVFANDHHAHWHMVYRADWERQERQGEVFLYMHQQMLARYDAERLGVGRDEIAPINLEGRVIEEGYDPETEAYTSRPDGTALPAADELRGRREAFEQAVASKFFEQAYEEGRFDQAYDPGGPQPALSLLGGVLEAESDDPTRAPLAFDGLNLHNDGHVEIAALGQPVDDGARVGVMSDPSVAIRDPVFWRWHKMIDNIGAAWQGVQTARDFSAAEDRGPELKLRGGEGDSPDLILCLQSAMPIDEQAGAAFAQGAFGEKWDQDFSTSAPGTGELLTHMTEREWEGRQISYLDMVEEFAYVIRVQNDGQPVETTVRIFIVPEQWREDRRKWVEMDKFLHTVPTGRSVIYRPSAASSVIRRPATRPPAPPPPEEDGRQPSSYCSCGWPYNLLLPRGNADGMPFRLLALLTNAAWDRADEQPCGSMSYCGVRDSRYPDRRNMGYPFDRSFAGGVVNTLAGLENAAMRAFTIRRVA